MLSLGGCKRGVGFVPVLVIVGIAVFSVVAIQSFGLMTGHAVSNDGRAIYNKGFLGVGDSRFMDESKVLVGRLNVQQGDEDVGLSLERNESFGGVSRSVGPSMRFSDSYNSYLDLVLNDVNTPWPFLSFVFSGSPAVAGFERLRIARDYLVIGDVSLLNQAIFGAATTIGQGGINGLSIVKQKGGGPSRSGATMQFVNDPANRDSAFTLALNDSSSGKPVLNFIQASSPLLALSTKFSIGERDVKVGNSGWVPGVYFSLDVKASAPPAVDCDSESEAGRMMFDSSSDKVYVCGGADGWGSIPLTFAAASP